MPVEPWVPAPTPAQIFLEDSVEHRWIRAGKPKRRGKNDVPTVVKYRVVVPELHIARCNDFSLALFRQDLARVEHLGDEHCALALGRRRQEVQVLPDCA